MKSTQQFLAWPSVELFLFYRRVFFKKLLHTFRNFCSEKLCIYHRPNQSSHPSCLKTIRVFIASFVCKQLVRSLRNHYSFLKFSHFFVKRFEIREKTKKKMGGFSNNSYICKMKIPHQNITIKLPNLNETWNPLTQKKIFRLHSV